MYKGKIKFLELYGSSDNLTGARGIIGDQILYISTISGDMIGTNDYKELHILVRPKVGVRENNFRIMVKVSTESCNKRGFEKAVRSVFYDVRKKNSKNI